MIICLKWYVDNLSLGYSFHYEFGRSQTLVPLLVIPHICYTANFVGGKMNGKQMLPTKFFGERLYEICLKFKRQWIFCIIKLILLIRLLYFCKESLRKGM